MPIRAIQRGALIFENPDMFDPLRWENPTREMLSAYQPFGLGRRNCIGRAMGVAELWRSRSCVGTHGLCMTKAWVDTVWRSKGLTVPRKLVKLSMVTL